MKALKKINSLNGKKEFAFILAAAVLIVGGVMIFVVTLNCGWHLVDDHEMLAWTYVLRSGQMTLRELFISVLKEDIHVGRWRPLYTAIRVIAVSLLRDNYVAYTVWAMLKTMLTFILLYYMARLMEADVIRALTFSMVSLIGYQACTWWKLGTHEMVSTLWFAFSMIFMLKYLKSNKELYAIINFLGFLVMSLYKESYIVTIPFVLLYIIYYELNNSPEYKENLMLESRIAGVGESADRAWIKNYFKELFRDIIAVIKNKWRYLLSLFLILIVNLTVILFVIGAGFLDDAEEITEGLSPLLGSLVIYDAKWFTYFGALMLMNIISHDVKVLKIWKEVVLFLVFALPQLYLYRTYGVNERYMLPLSIGYAFFFIVLVPQNLQIGRLRKYAYAAIVLLLLLANGRAMLREADYYRYRGNSIMAMLNTVRDISSADSGMKVLSCLYPNQEGVNTMYMYNLLAGYDNVYVYKEDFEDKSFVIEPARYDGLPDSSQPEADSMDDMDVVVAYNKKDRHWCYTPAVDLSGFDRYSCGTLFVYIRKGALTYAPQFDVRDTLFEFGYYEE